MYTGALAIPVTVIHPHPLVAAAGLVMALVAVAVAALAPALDAARVPPAEAMRGLQPPQRGGVGALDASSPSSVACRRRPSWSCAAPCAILAAASPPWPASCSPWCW